MAKTVNIRRWDEATGGYVEVKEIWPSAVFDEATGQWCLDGMGWRMVFDAPPSAADAQRICEAIADNVRQQL